QVAADSLTRDKEPLSNTDLPFDCAQTATQREIVLASFVTSSELDPRISRSVGVPAHEQIPFDSLRRIRVGLQSLRTYFAVEQKRKLQCENTGLACAVISPQQQPSILIMKFFAIVPVQIDQTAAQGLPSLPAGRRHRLCFRSHGDYS